MGKGRGKRGQEAIESTVCLYRIVALSCCLSHSILMFFFLFAVNFVIFSLRATIVLNLNLNLREGREEREGRGKVR